MPEVMRIPRIVPTSDRLEAMVGIWELNGEMVRLMVEPGTGVLVALTTDGGRLNPMRVISHGSKWDGAPPH